MAHNPDIQPTDWRAVLGTALRERDTGLTDLADKTREHQALAYLLWGQWREGRELEPAEWTLLSGAKSAHAHPLANNPSTPASVLKELALDEDWLVREAVALNRSTPASMLEVLAQDTEEFARRMVAKNPSTPVKVLELLARDDKESIRQSVAENSLTPEPLRMSVLQVLEQDLDRLAKDNNESVRRRVAENAFAPVSVLESLAKDQNEFVRRAVAGNPSTPVNVLEALGTEPHEYVRKEVAFNDSAPRHLRTSLLAALAKSDVYIQQKVAENPSTPVKALEELAKYDDGRARTAVARNPSTPLSLLEALAKDPEELVRREVSRNPSTAVKVLELLANDPQTYVRSDVACNTSTPLSLLKVLARDRKTYVRAAVATNLSAPKSFRLGLLDDLSTAKEGYVRRNVAENPSASANVLKLLSKDKNADVRHAVAENPSTPASVLRHLTKDKDSWVRRLVASRYEKGTSTPASVLKDLARDKNSWIREAVAKNPSTPVEALEYLAWDENKQVRDRVAENPSAPAAVLKLLVLEPEVHENDRTRVQAAWTSKSRSAVLRAEFLSRLCAGLKPSYARVYGLMLQDCPARALSKCAKSSLWLERCAVAQHGRTPKNLLASLKNDTHPAVRAAAQWRLAQECGATGEPFEFSKALLLVTKQRKFLLRRIPKRHPARLFTGNPITIAATLDGLLQAANGARSVVMSRKTVASLLRVIIDGEQLAWARSNQGGSGSATFALCARTDPDKLCIAITRGRAYKGSPGCAWPHLRPWRPATKGTTERLGRWLHISAGDRLRLSIAKARSVASELIKLPPSSITKRKVSSVYNEIFVIRDFRPFR